MVQGLGLSARSGPGCAPRPSRCSSHWACMLCSPARRQSTKLALQNMFCVLTECASCGPGNQVTHAGDRLPPLLASKRQVWTAFSMGTTHGPCTVHVKTTSASSSSRSVTTQITCSWGQHGPQTSAASHAMRWQSAGQHKVTSVAPPQVRP